MNNLKTSQQFYETGDYLEHNQSWHTEDSPWKAGNILKILKRNRIKPESICEVGCGAGEILRQMSLKLPKKTEFYGYEISPQAYEMSQSRENEHTHFFLKDLLAEDPSVRFDLVMAIDVFEHVEDDFGFVRKLKERGGYKIYHIPLDITVNGILQDKFMHGRKTVGHIHYYTKETALALLQDTGHEIIDWFYTADSLELPRKTFKSKVAKVPRKLLFGLRPDLTVKLFGGFSMMVLAR
ncbi:MAG: class I SAM-dependent methyltransferase [Cyclobacteriaceae bacterium]